MIIRLGRYELSATKWFAVACILAAGIPCFAQSQTTSPLDEIVVTAKSLEENLPQELSQYGTHLDVVTASQIQNGGYIDVASALDPHPAAFDVALCGAHTGNEAHCKQEGIGPWQ
jgi:outer membrane cobalamin receptor